jgi:hypothetical protein
MAASLKAKGKSQPIAAAHGSATPMTAFYVDVLIEMARASDGFLR